MADKKDDSNREKINEELEKVKEENSKKPGFLERFYWERLYGMFFKPPFVTCYVIILPQFRCPKCHVKLEPDPEKEYVFRCPKCKKGFNHSDLTDSE